MSTTLHQGPALMFEWIRKDGTSSGWWLSVAVVSTWLFLVGVWVGRFFSHRSSALGLLPTLVYLHGPRAMAFSSALIWFITTLFYMWRAACGSSILNSSKGYHTELQTIVGRAPSVTVRKMGCLPEEGFPSPPPDNEVQLPQVPKEKAARQKQRARANFRIQNRIKKRERRIVRYLKTLRRVCCIPCRLHKKMLVYFCNSPRIVVLAWLFPFVLLQEAWYTCGSYETFKMDLDHRWGFLVEGPSGTDQNNKGNLDVSFVASQAPILLTTFGTQYDNLWWKYMTRYLCEKNVHWVYSSLNGDRPRGETDMYSLLKEDMVTLRHEWKLEALRRLMGDSPIACETM